MAYLFWTIWNRFFGFRSQAEEATEDDIMAASSVRALIVGLGNHGSGKQRHSVGHRIVLALAKRRNLDSGSLWRKRRDLNAFLAVDNLEQFRMWKNAFWTDTKVLQQNRDGINFENAIF